MTTPPKKDEKPFPVGRPRKYPTPEALQAKCQEYFDWCEANPILKHDIKVAGGVLQDVYIEKKRMTTIQGLCLHLQVNRTTWNAWRAENPEYSEVISWAEDYMDNLKISYAAADELNANIISRLMGLADKQDHSSSDGTMSPKPTISVAELTDDQLASIIGQQSN